MKLCGKNKCSGLHWPMHRPRALVFVENVFQVKIFFRYGLVSGEIWWGILNLIILISFSGNWFWNKNKCPLLRTQWQKKIIQNLFQLLIHHIWKSIWLSCSYNNNWMRCHGKWLWKYLLILIPLCGSKINSPWHNGAIWYFRDSSLLVHHIGTAPLTITMVSFQWKLHELNCTSNTIQVNWVIKVYLKIIICNWNHLTEASMS